MQFELLDFLVREFRIGLKVDPFKLCFHVIRETPCRSFTNHIPKKLALNLHTVNST